MKKQTTWDNRFLDLCEHISEWSKDPSTKVGAVITDKNHRVISMGYNGAPQGVSEPSESNREQKLLRTIHAEANALHFANRDVSGCTLYVNLPPCAHCAAHIIQRGIKRVVYNFDRIKHASFYTRWHLELSEAMTMFRESGVEIVPVEKNDLGSLDFDV